MSTFSIHFDVSALDAQVDALQDDMQQALRPAAQAGAQLLYDHVLLNTPRSDKGHWFHGTSFKVNGKKYWFDSGTLRQSVYQAFATKESHPLHPVYSVGFNPRKCPYAYMVEYGTSKTRPVKFVGRVQAQFPRALDKAQSEFFNRLKYFK